MEKTLCQKFKAVSSLIDMNESSIETQVHANQARTIEASRKTLSIQLLHSRRKQGHYDANYEPLAKRRLNFSHEKTKHNNNNSGKAKSKNEQFNKGPRFKRRMEWVVTVGDTLTGAMRDVLYRLGVVSCRVVATWNESFIAVGGELQSSLLFSVFGSCDDGGGKFCGFGCFSVTAAIVMVSGEWVLTREIGGVADDSGNWLLQ
ncbi:hypothetical protein ACFE04_015335 [Oxalis oulophora]